MNRFFAALTLAMNLLAPSARAQLLDSLPTAVELARELKVQEPELVEAIPELVKISFLERNAAAMGEYFKARERARLQQALLARSKGTAQTMGLNDLLALWEVAAVEHCLLAREKLSLSTLATVECLTRREKQYAAEAQVLMGPVPAVKTL